MRTVADVRLRAEASRFHLRFACDDCAEFDATKEQCALGYPPAPRRGALDAESLEFCKAFELA